MSERADINGAIAILKTAAKAPGGEVSQLRYPDSPWRGKADPTMSLLLKMGYVELVKRDGSGPIEETVWRITKAGRAALAAG